MPIKHYTVSVYRRIGHGRKGREDLELVKAHALNQTNAKNIAKKLWRKKHRGKRNPVAKIIVKPSR